MAPIGGMGAAMYVAQHIIPAQADYAAFPVISAAGLLSVGLKSGQNAFERILLLAFAFAPDFMLLSASWEPFFLWNFTTILLCWMHLEHTGATEATTTSKRNGVKQPAAHRVLKFSDIYRGLVFLFLVHAVSLAFLDQTSELSCYLTSCRDSFAPGTLLAYRKGAFVDSQASCLTLTHKQELLPCACLPDSSSLPTCHHVRPSHVQDHRTVHPFISGFRIDM